MSDKFLKTICLISSFLFAVSNGKFNTSDTVVLRVGLNIFSKNVATSVFRNPSVQQSKSASPEIIVGDAEL